MKTKWIDKKIKYTGEQLSSKWAEKKFTLAGDSIVSFRGPCNVNEKYMVDLEDLKKKEFIYSEDMLHFIVEIFELNLARAVALQRLLVIQIKELIEAQKKGLKLTRAGDDLYDGKNKLSVSIATLSPVSSLIHVGVNISSKNTPVPTKGLEDYDVDPAKFAKKTLTIFQEEFISMQKAKQKVKSVL